MLKQRRRKIDKKFKQVVVGPVDVILEEEENEVE
jgi:hypothetical protein